jgi:hypothetical protein
MEEIKREDQIEKIQSLINKKDVSRRDFFGTLGKIAVLSQVVALAAGGFLASCVAFEDKEGSSGILKTCTSPDGNGYFTCPSSFTCDGGGGTFSCEANENFSCGESGTYFRCHDINNGGFGCDTTFVCGGQPGEYPPTGSGFHLGSCGTC